MIYSTIQSHNLIFESNTVIWHISSGNTLNNIYTSFIIYNKGPGKYWEWLAIQMDGAECSGTSPSYNPAWNVYFV